RLHTAGPVALWRAAVAGRVAGDGLTVRAGRQRLVLLAAGHRRDRVHGLAAARRSDPCRAGRGQRDAPLAWPRARKKGARGRLLDPLSPCISRATAAWPAVAGTRCTATPGSPSARRRRTTPCTWA